MKNVPSHNACQITIRATTSLRKGLWKFPSSGGLQTFDAIVRRLDQRCARAHTQGQVQQHQSSAIITQALSDPRACNWCGCFALALTFGALGARAHAAVAVHLHLVALDNDVLEPRVVLLNRVLKQFRERHTAAKTLELVISPQPRTFHACEQRLSRHQTATTSHTGVPFTARSTSRAHVPVKSSVKREQANCCLSVDRQTLPPRPRGLSRAAHLTFPSYTP